MAESFPAGDNRSPVKSSTLNYLRAKTKKPGVPKSARDSLSTGLVASLSSKSGKIEIRAEDEIVAGYREIVQRAYLRVPGENYTAGWVLDDEVSSCMQCAKDFSLFRGKHHCRHCGDIICDNCSKTRIVLSNIKSSKAQRVCNVCTVKLKAQMNTAAKNASMNKARQLSDDRQRNGYSDDEAAMQYRNTIGSIGYEEDHVMFKGQQRVSLIVKTDFLALLSS